MSVRLVTPWMRWQPGINYPAYGRYYIDEYHRQATEGAFCSIVMVESVQRIHRVPFWYWLPFDEDIKDKFYHDDWEAQGNSKFETAEEAMTAADKWLKQFNLKYISEAAFNLMRSK